MELIEIIRGYAKDRQNKNWEVLREACETKYTGGFDEY